MQAGRLNRRVTITQESTAQDFMGQEVSTWNPVAVLWASIDVQASQLLYSTAEFISKAVIRITFRWTNSVVILPNMRIVYAEAGTGIIHTYEIQSLVNDKQGNRQLMALCYELEGEV
jgi:SPP1 family predicted phage head-tail adaptor